MAPIGCILPRDHIPPVHVPVPVSEISAFFTYVRTRLHEGRAAVVSHNRNALAVSYTDGYSQQTPDPSQRTPDRPDAPFRG